MRMLRVLAVAALAESEIVALLAVKTKSALLDRLQAVMRIAYEPTLHAFVHLALSCSFHHVPLELLLHFFLEIAIDGPVKVLVLQQVHIEIGVTFDLVRLFGLVIPLTIGFLHRLVVDIGNEICVQLLVDLFK
jgi:hypothetical protein